MKLISLILILTTPLAFSAKGPVFVEKGGIVAIEAESTGSSKGRWKVKTDVKDFSGTCHLDFTGNSETNRPPTPPLKYYFKIKKPGKYELTISGRSKNFNIDRCHSSSMNRTNFATSTKTTPRKANQRTP